ncbi:MAG TPA: Ig domain-containing protein [Polyangiaceae bacterium]|nr:Ig domain-containing protein [Polyangiaceae bacterium]
MTRHVPDFRSTRGLRHAQAAVRAAASALLALASACFSPVSYTEHLCRECTNECPDGLVCYEQRCVRGCDSSCTGDYHCVEGVACLPVEDDIQCPTRSVPMALCVGQPVEGGTSMRADASSEEPWVVLNSQLPQGVSFDPDTGTLKGTPERAEPGSLTARHGEPGSEEVSLDLQVLANGSCASIETTEFNWCSGVSKTERLVASPLGQYEWRIESPIPGLSQQGDQLSGRIEAPGTYELRIELSQSGRLVDVQSVALNVADCSMHPDRVPAESLPLDIITPAALPDACEGIAYTAEFAATGGTPAYRWSIEAAPLGLALNEETGRLTGMPRESGDFQLSVSVDDGAGNRDTLAAELHIGNATEGCIVGNPDSMTGEDPECGVAGKPACERPPLAIVTTDVGVACAGVNFSAQLQATGGGGDYHWLLQSNPRYPVPSGFTLEPNGQLHGVPSAAEIGVYNISVTVMSAVTDNPPAANVKIEIADCDGLVYISDEPGSDRLFRVGAGTASSSELSEGLLASGESVHSFAFSSDGAHLAFDVRSDGGAGRLYWANLNPLDVRQPAFAPALPDATSVLDYRWSLDGRYLAATFDTGSQVFLGVTPADGSTGTLIEVSAQYVANLFWAGGRICYVAAGLQAPFLGVRCHAITAQGVQNQAPLSGIFDPTAFFRQDLILSGDEGYLAIFSDEIHAEYLLPDEQATSIQHTDRVFSSSLRWAAGLTGDESIGEVVTSQGSPDEVTLLAKLDPCDNVDAWSLDERSIACRIGDALAIHQLAADGTLSRSVRVEDSDGYAGEEFRRLWAPRGQWYAYAAGGNLNVVPIDGAPRSRVVVEGGARTSYAGLSTDAAGQRIFYHHGAALDVVDTAADFSFRNINGAVTLPDPAACAESYLEEGPRLWCGAASTPAFVFPAPAAPRVAFVDRDNRLYVADVVAPSAGVEPSAPRLVSASSVKCTMDSGETQCDNFVKWVPRAPR